MYEARVCGFEAELPASEGGGLSVGADVFDDVFDGSNVDPVRLQNAHVAWITLINSCRGMSFDFFQRSEAPNDARRNLQPLYRSKRTRKILRLSNEIDGKTMGSGGDLFKIQS